MPTASLDAKKALALRLSEPAVLKRLVARAQEGPPRDLVVIPDADGEPMFAFWVHMLEETVYERLTTQYSPTRHDEATGLDVPGQLNQAAFRTALILEATDPEDREALWKNQEIRSAYHVMTENQLVDKLLGWGLKLAVVQRIDALAGAGRPLPRVDKLEELLGNSSSPVEGSPSATASGSATE